MKRRTLVLCAMVALSAFAGAQCDGNSHTGTYYVDNSCGSNGSGASSTCGTAGPFNSIASMEAKSGGYTAGNYICLKRGAIFRETFTLPSSGTSGSHIVLDAYGAGDKPTIKASDIFSPWNSVSGATFQSAALNAVSLLWKDGEFQTQGSSATELNNHEWFWDAGILYYREDERDLGSHVIEGSTRSSGIFNNAKSFWDLNNVRTMHTGDSAGVGYGFSFQGGSGFTLNDCEAVETRALQATSTPSMVVNRCVFKFTHGGSYWPQFGIDKTTSITVNNTLFRGSDIGSPTFQISGAATANIYNSVFDGYGGNAILSTSTGITNIQNSIFTGGVSGWGNATMVRTGSGAVNVDYSLILPYGRDGRNFLTGITEGTHNLYTAPNFRSSAAKGYLVIGSDDTGWYRYFDESTKTADQYGYKVGFMTDTADLTNFPESVGYIQDAINRGHWISNHTNSHADLSVFTGFTVQYVGSGTAATMTIASSHLTTQVTGAAADNLNLDMTNPNYNNLASLCDYLESSTGGKYSCTGTADPNRYTAATNLADVSQVNIKSAGYAAVLDLNRYYTFEINGAHAAITSMLKNPDGTPYSLDTFVYPWGSVVPDAAVAWLQSLHYLGARSTLDWLSYPGWTTSAGVDLYGMLTTTGVNGLGQLAYIAFDTNCTDFGEDRWNFTCKNLTYSTQIPPISEADSHSGIFNGTSAYAQRTDASIDFHRGDGYWSAYLRPTVVNKKQALFYHGSDDNNYHTLYLSASGTVVYSVVAAGAETVHVETQAGLLSTGVWQRVTLTFNQKTYKIFVGAPESASVYSTTGPGAYTGPFTVGAGGSATLQNFYSGNMSSMSFGANAFASATAMLDTLSSQGGVIFLYGHGDPGLPVPIERIIFQAKAASSANVMLDSYHNVLTDLRARGTLADNRTLTWRQADGSDYQLLPDSALINAGSATGAPGTDFNGNPRSGPPDIGIYEYANVLKHRSHSYWW